MSSVSAMATLNSVGSKKQRASLPLRDSYDERDSAAAGCRASAAQQPALTITVTKQEDAVPLPLHDHDDDDVGAVEGRGGGGPLGADGCGRLNEIFEIPVTDFLPEFLYLCRQSLKSRKCVVNDTGN